MTRFLRQQARSLARLGVLVGLFQLGMSFQVSHTQQPPTSVAPMTGVTQKSLQQQLTVGFPPPNPCPKGYAASPSDIQTVHLVICEAQQQQGNICAAHVGDYQCGLEASQCCAQNKNNPCFPGGYSCKGNASPGTSGQHACCLSQ